MARIVAKIEGLDALRRALLTTPKVVQKRIYTVIRAGAEAVAADARRNVPGTGRTSGALADSIVTLGRGVTWRAGVGQGKAKNLVGLDPFIYGMWVEYGTARTAAKPFMRPAAEAERQRLPGRLAVLARVIETEMEE